ncbi:DUF6397 family protein [Streptomyces albulus]|nr:DUF6397 family protein [Streptomyces noursei]
MRDGRQTLSTARAAQELELRTGECELATQLGEVRTVRPGPRIGREAADRPAGSGCRRRRSSGSGPNRTSPRRSAPDSAPSPPMRRPPCWVSAPAEPYGSPAPAA